MSDQASRQDIERTLEQFHGTSKWYRHGTFRTLYWTEGVQYLADAAQAYWLIDAVGSWQFEPKVRRENFQAWTLTVHTHKQSTLVCTDGNKKRVAQQKIPYTDFPLEEVTLWLSGDATEQVLMLPGEY
jgi:hypothetical protein